MTISAKAPQKPTSQPSGQDGVASGVDGALVAGLGLDVVAGRRVPSLVRPALVPGRGDDPPVPHAVNSIRTSSTPSTWVTPDGRETAVVRLFRALILAAEDSARMPAVCLNMVR